MNTLNMDTAKKLSQEEAASTSKKTWYLENQAVLNPNKPGKLPAVFDAAPRYNNVALNNCLLVGLPEQSSRYLNEILG